MDPLALTTKIKSYLDFVINDSLKPIQPHQTKPIKAEIDVMLTDLANAKMMVAEVESSLQVQSDASQTKPDQLERICKRLTEAEKDLKLFPITVTLLISEIGIENWAAAQHEVDRIMGLLKSVVDELHISLAEGEKSVHES